MRTKILLDHFNTALNGWEIIAKAPEAREGARRLLSWLADNLNIPKIALQYHDKKTDYRWEEQAINPRRAYSKGELIPLSIPFPEGCCHWYIETQEPVEKFLPFLNLFASQWFRLFQNNKPWRTNTRLIAMPVLGNFYEDWVAVSSASKMFITRFSELVYSTAPLMLIGEEGSGRSYLARILHNRGPYPESPFYTEQESEKPGTYYSKNWTKESSSSLRGKMEKNHRIIVSSTVPIGGGKKDYLSPWLEEMGKDSLILCIPSLRERQEEIPLLTSLLIEKQVRERNFPSYELSKMAVEALCSYHWPGNFPELRESIFYASLRAENNRICINDLPSSIRGACHSTSAPSLIRDLKIREQESINQELSYQRGNIRQTAEALGLSVRQLSCRIQKYKIKPQDFKRRKNNSGITPQVFFAND